MSRVEQIEVELGKMSQVELRQVRDWLDDLIEDELEFTPEFESQIQKSEHLLAVGHRREIYRGV